MSARKGGREGRGARLPVTLFLVVFDPPISFTVVGSTSVPNSHVELFLGFT